MWPGDAETSCANECNWIFISIVFIAVFVIIGITPGIVIYVMSQSLSILTAIIQVNLG